MNEKWIELEMKNENHEVWNEQKCKKCLNWLNLIAPKSQLIYNNYN